jgi:hypothetical protein
MTKHWTVAPVEMNDRNTEDASLRPHLLNLNRLSEDWQRDRRQSIHTRKCHNANADHSVAAIFPPCKAAYPWKTATIEAVAQQYFVRTAVSVAGTVVKIEWLLPPKPRRNHDALNKTA